LILGRDFLSFLYIERSFFIFFLPLVPSGICVRLDLFPQVVCSPSDDLPFSYLSHTTFWFNHIFWFFLMTLPQSFPTHFKSIAVFLSPCTFLQLFPEISFTKFIHHFCVLLNPLLKSRRPPKVLIKAFYCTQIFWFQFFSVFSIHYY